MDFIQSLFGVLVGGALTIAASFFGVRWQMKKEAESDKRKRSRECAEELLRLVDDGHKLFEGLWQHGTAPDQDQVRSIKLEIERHSLLLQDETARSNLDLVADAFFHADALDQMGEGTPSKIAYTTRREARETLGALLRDERIRPSEKLEGYKLSIRDHYAQFDDV